MDGSRSEAVPLTEIRFCAFELSQATVTSPVYFEQASETKKGVNKKSGYGERRTWDPGSWPFSRTRTGELVELKWSLKRVLLPGLATDDHRGAVWR